MLDRLKTKLTEFEYAVVAERWAAYDALALMDTHVIAFDGWYWLVNGARHGRSINVARVAMLLAMGEPLDFEAAKRGSSAELDWQSYQKSLKRGINQIGSLSPNIGAHLYETIVLREGIAEYTGRWIWQTNGDYFEEAGFGSSDKNCLSRTESRKAK